MAAEGKGQDRAGAGSPAMFKGTDYSFPRTMVALALWLGAIHFNVVLVVVALLFLPIRIGLAVLALQLFFMVIPLNEKSGLGRRLARFICKYAAGYFPLTLHVEDLQAFDPNQAYVFGYEPHSVFAIGVWGLMNHTGFMPLPKIKFLGSSAIFHIPFMRQIWTWLGVVPTTRKNFYKYLEAGYSCVVVPGGVREMFHMEYDTENLAFGKLGPVPGGCGCYFAGLAHRRPASRLPPLAIAVAGPWNDGSWSLGVGDMESWSMEIGDSQPSLISHATMQGSN